MTDKFHLYALLALLCLPLSAAAQVAVDIETALGESEAYILYSDGTLKVFGTAVHRGDAEGVDAVDLVLTPTADGYYILDEEGDLRLFGDAFSFGVPQLGRSENLVDLEPTPDFLGMYFMNDEGKIYTVGDAVFRGERIADDAVDFELTSSGEGYIVLYESGELAFFGDAVNRGSIELRSTSSRVAVDLEIVQGGYYVLYSDGALEAFGLALALPPARSLEGDAVAVSLSGQGYRVIDENGDLLSFIRPELQSLTRSIPGPLGRTSIYAETGPVPLQTTPEPSPDDPFFELSNDEFTEQMIGKLPAGKNIADSLTTGQASLATGGTFILLADEGALPREIQWFPPGTFGSANSGTLFAVLNEDRGGASIAGVSYSSEEGLIVLVREFDGIYLMLIEGDFSPTAIAGFRQY